MEIKTLYISALTILLQFIMPESRSINYEILLPDILKTFRISPCHLKFANNWKKTELLIIFKSLNMINRMCVIEISPTLMYKDIWIGNNWTNASIGAFLFDDIPSIEISDVKINQEFYYINVNKSKIYEKYNVKEGLRIQNNLGLVVNSKLELKRY